MTKISGLVVRSSVPSVTHYREYREQLRIDFWHSCAYCTITELEAAGIRFTIDHYEPKSIYPSLTNDYSNLMWSCGHCNELKGDVHSEAAARLAGDRFLRPDQDDEDDHYTYSETSDRVNPRTAEATFTIEVLNLNRQTLRRLRSIRRELEDSHSAIVKGLRALSKVSPEQIPLRHRAQFAKIREQLRLRSEALDDSAGVLRSLQKLGYSELIDPDPDAENASKQRKSFLEARGAIHSQRFRGKPRRS